jgi:hypothetical protein
VNTDPNRTAQPPARLELVLSSLLAAAAIAFGRVLGSTLGEQLVAALGWAG